MLPDLGVIKVGFEVEIPAYKNKVTWKDKAKKLLDQNYMLGDKENWRAIHRYRCNCHSGCGYVRRGDVYVPPLVSATYDASLPEGGVEWVTSPVVLVQGGLEPIRPIWDIITEDAEWRRDLLNMRGTGYCSPSIHIHCSVTHAGAEDEYTEPTVGEDMLHALYLFSPELLLMADTAGVRRGLMYRQPSRRADEGGHHGFVQIRRALLPTFLHIEWRMFEAVYNDFSYLEKAAYLSAVLTRGLSDETILNELLRTGLDVPFDAAVLQDATRREDVDDALALVSMERLTMLREACTDMIHDDPYGHRVINNFFEEAANHAR